MYENTDVILTAEASDDGDIASYEWRFVGVDIPYSEQNTDSIAFSAPEVDQDGWKTTIEVIVKDDDGAITSASYELSVLNMPEMAEPEAGNPLSAMIGNSVVLDGSASDISPDLNVTWVWQITIPDGTTKEYNDLELTFVPEQSGTYKATLLLTDEFGRESSDSTELVVAEEDAPPVAVVGDNISAMTGIEVAVNGRESYDPNGDTLIYEWTLLKPGASEVSPELGNDTLVFTPDIPGEYIATLRVVANGVPSETAEVTVTAEQGNSTPTANAGLNTNGYPDLEVPLAVDVIPGEDADGDALTYQWTISEGPEGHNAYFTDDTAESPEFVSDIVGDFVLTLTVSDGTKSDSDNVMVAINEATLSIEKKGIFGDWERVTFPYASNGTISANIMGSSTMTLGEYRIAANGDDFVITELNAEDRNMVVTPSFNGLVDGQIIANGEEVEFSIESPLTGGMEADLLFEFSVEGDETQTFRVINKLTTN